MPEPDTAKEQAEQMEQKVEKAEEEVSEEEEAKLKLPFPTAAVVRIMKANMDKEKMIRKDVKIAMNKWLGNMCAHISKEMNRLPYVMMHLHEFNEAKRMYTELENFDKEKGRILAHMDAIKKDIQRLERDLGKAEEEVIKMEKKE
jgi:histone H3/H4